MNFLIYPARNRLIRPILGLRLNFCLDKDLEVLRHGELGLVLKSQLSEEQKDLKEANLDALPHRGDTSPMSDNFRGKILEVRELDEISAQKKYYLQVISVTY